MKRYKAIAEYYDTENAHHLMLQQDVPLLLDHLPRKSQSILELACGTGRAAIPLAQAGHRVVGVDYAGDMLEIARRKRDLAGLAEGDLTLVRGDILQARIARKFDWIVLLFNTFLAFPTLGEQDAVLQNVVRHLKPRGHFWVDIFQPNLGLIARDVSEDLDPYVFYVPHLKRTVFKTTSVVRDPAQQMQRITFLYVWFDADGAEHRKKIQFTLTFIFPRELRILLARNGLRIEKLYGNYDASPLTADSPRMIALCRAR